MMTRNLYVYGDGRDRYDDRVMSLRDESCDRASGPPSRLRVSLTVHPGPLGERCRVEAVTDSGASAWLIPSEDDYIAEAERWALARWPTCEITWIELDRKGLGNS